VTRLWNGQSGIEIQKGKEISLIQNVQTYSGAYPVFYSMHMEGLFCWLQVARG